VVSEGLAHEKLAMQSKKPEEGSAPRGEHEGAPSQRQGAADATPPANTVYSPWFPSTGPVDLVSLLNIVAYEPSPNPAPHALWDGYMVVEQEGTRMRLPFWVLPERPLHLGRRVGQGRPGGAPALRLRREDRTVLPGQPSTTVENNGTNGAPTLPSSSPTRSPQEQGKER
jgi:hypothetical protein